MHGYFKEERQSVKEGEDSWIWVSELCAELKSTFKVSDININNISYIVQGRIVQYAIPVLVYLHFLWGLDIYS